MPACWRAKKASGRVDGFIVEGPTADGHNAPPRGKDESGIQPEFKRRTIELCIRGEADVVTDPLASPTGFPFKVLRMEGSMSEQSVYENRQRVCDLGFLRQAYRKDDGTIGWRCPGEKVAAYTHKGGKLEDTVGRKCICNGLIANVGFAQNRRDGFEEPAILTCGDDVANITQFLRAPESASYTAADVVECLLSGVKAEVSV